MGRHKKVHIPFLKIKLRSNTVYSIFALLLFLFFALSVLSFNQSATALNSLNSFLRFYFGKGAILFPIIFLFASGALLQSRRVKLVKSNWFWGYVFIFLSLLTVLNTGYVGRFISEQASELLSRPGTVVTFSTLILIGILVMFQISLQDFLKFVAVVIEKIYKYFLVLSTEMRKKAEKAEVAAKAKEEFVGEERSREFAMMKKPELAIEKSKPVEYSIDPFSKSMHIRTNVSQWRFPPLSLLDIGKEEEAERGDVKKNAYAIEEALDSFGIKARVVDINYGPAVTQYALQIAKGVKLNRITSLSNNLALALAAPQGLIRIEAPIPGKPLVGIEVPNLKPQTVTLKKMLQTPPFADRSRMLLIPLGLDVSGSPVDVEINQMPHILVAGTTGSGKSVMLSAWIATILFRTTPEEVRLILIDPKRVTFSVFEDIPHLLTNVITDPKETISALKWAVKQMEERYKILAAAKTRDIFSYNASLKEEEERMSYIVIFIDELADLMMYASKDVEDAITRIAQKARAVGIYLVIATQRPSVDVITGLMKANIPARIAFNVSSMIDSRVILDMPGAEKLLGRGDMLFLPPDQAKPKRIQGPFIAEKEIKNLVEFLKKNAPVVHYTDEITQQEVKTVVDTNGRVTMKTESKDPLFQQAVILVCETRKASASLFQRKFSIGYSRAARLLDELEQEGIVGKSDHSKPREVLISTPSEVLNRQ